MPTISKTNGKLSMRRHTMVSVVMATYNGTKYLDKQLCSIRDQTLRPDEVIICDDGSTDQTVELVEQFIKENRLENWSITRLSLIHI